MQRFVFPATIADVKREAGRAGSRDRDVAGALGAARPRPQPHGCAPGPGTVTEFLERHATIEHSAEAVTSSPTLSFSPDARPAGVEDPIDGDTRVSDANVNAPEPARGRRPGRRRAAQGRLRQARGRDGQGHRRPARGARGAADRHLRPRPLPADRRAGAGQDPDDPHPGRRPEPDLQPDPVHARPDALGHHRHRGDPGGQGDRRPPVQVPPRARSSPTSSWPTRSTGPRPRPRPPCSRRCRSGR